VEGRLPDLLGATTWLNSTPLSPQALRGKVVLVDFWTFARINCQRALPHVRAWAEKYKDEGLIVIGVHSPEFAFERDIANVKRANDFAIWRAFSNQYWPAHYSSMLHGARPRPASAPAPVPTAGCYPGYR
jgi:thiol-disulfide isomerase/thioredoxin